MPALLASTPEKNIALHRRTHCDSVRCNTQHTCYFRYVTADTALMRRLHDAAQRAQAARDILEDALATRDDLIVDAATAKIPHAEIGRVAGISRVRVIRILGGG